MLPSLKTHNAYSRSRLQQSCCSLPGEVAPDGVELGLSWPHAPQATQSLQVEQRLQVGAAAGGGQSQGQNMAFECPSWHEPVQKQQEDEGRVVECEHSLDDDNDLEGLFLHRAPLPSPPQCVSLSSHLFSPFCPSALLLRSLLSHLVGLSFVVLFLLPHHVFVTRRRFL